MPRAARRTWFNNRNKNVTQEEIARGIEEHTALARSYLDNKILLTKANLFQKMWSYWNSYIAPREISFAHVLLQALNENPQKYALSATIFMNGSGQMNRSAAEVYWLLCMGKPISEYEIRHLIFQPKNAFSSVEYLPHETHDEPTSSALFGEDDEE